MTRSMLSACVGSATGLLVVAIWSQGVGLTWLSVLLGASLLLLVAMVFRAQVPGTMTAFRISHPAGIMVAAVLGTLLSAVLLMEASAGTLAAYLELRLLEVIGYAVGFLLAWYVFRRPQSGRRPSRNCASLSIANKRLRILTAVLTGVSALAALVFFSIYGIPALTGDVGNARIDLASTGTGYLRVLAHLSIPATIMAWIDGPTRRSFATTAFGVLLLVGMGNRSVLLYLLAPIAVLAWSKARTSRHRLFMALAAVGGILVIVGGGAAWRVSATSEYHRYEEFAAAVEAGDYLRVASVATRQYAVVIPENTLLAKRLIDERVLPRQWGATYLAPVLTALPGQQKAVDMQLKEAALATFSGGGIPPTLAGEAYINFELPGIPLVAALAGLGLASIGLRTRARPRAPDEVFMTLAYGYAACYFTLAQIAGVAGASTVPALMAIVLVASYGWAFWR